VHSSRIGHGKHAGAGTCAFLALQGDSIATPYASALVEHIRLNRYSAGVRARSCLRERTDFACAARYVQKPRESSWYRRERRRDRTSVTTCVSNTCETVEALQDPCVLTIFSSSCDRSGRSSRERRIRARETVVALTRYAVCERWVTFSALVSMLKQYE
jgi:hypothetical protein